MWMSNLCAPIHLILNVDMIQFILGLGGLKPFPIALLLLSLLLLGHRPAGMLKSLIGSRGIIIHIDILRWI